MKRLFVNNGDSTYLVCDFDASIECRQAIGEIVYAEVENQDAFQDPCELTFTVREMTDEQVAALPEM